MAETKRAFTGRRYFSQTEQDDYSTPETLVWSASYEGEFMNILANERVDNQEEITGYQEPTADEILNFRGEGRHVKRCLPNEAAFLFASCLGKVTQDQPDAGGAANTYRHWIERDLTSPLAKAFTMVEDNGATKNRYQAVIARAVRLIGERGGFVRLESDLMSMGQEEDNADSDPGAISGETYLRYGDVEFQRGGSLSGTVAGGDLTVGGSPDSLKANLRSFNAGVDNNAEALYEFGDDTGYVTRFEIGDRHTHELSAELEFQDDGHFAGLSAGTEYVMSIPIIGATIEDVQKYTVELIYPRVVYNEVSKSRDGNKLIVSPTWKVLEDPTFGSLIVKVINKQQSYLT